MRKWQYYLIGENKVAKFHFVEDYQKHVKYLMKTKPLDEAMSEAVGGGFKEIGQVLKDIVIYSGLREKMKLLDYGCGSGRLSHAISQEIDIEYTGIDVVDELLKYAKNNSPKHYKFIKNHKLTIPEKEYTFDIVCAFSLFTHLLHTETYLYLEEIYRVLKNKGRLVFSFLEFAMPSHWAVFKSTIEQQKNSTVPHLNTFIERNVIEIWAQKIGFKIVEFINGDDKRFNGKALGQSIVILKKNETTVHT